MPMITSCMMSREQCISADWEEIGARDGRNGELPGELDRHKKACSYYDIAANVSLYKLGRERGLKTYCQIQRQVDLGVKGEVYREVCSGEIVKLLMEANGWGLRYYHIDRALSSSRSQLGEVNSKLESKKLSKDEMYRLFAEKGRLTDEIDRLTHELKRVKIMGEEFLNRKLR